MTDTADILIIGGGVMGTSIAYHLARQSGVRVEVLERQSICSGTTGRSGAIVRQHYSNDFTIRMAKESLSVYQHFDDIVGGDCGFITTGMIVMTNEQGTDALRENVKIQQAQGVHTHLLNGSEVGQTAQGYNGAGVALACYEPDAGVADPMATTHCFAQRARDFGSIIREGIVVTHILHENNRVIGVRTLDGDIHAPIVVIAANVWSARLAQTASVTLPLTPTRHPMLSLRRPNDFGGLHGIHAVGLDITRQIYLRPDLGGVTLVGSTADVLAASDPDHYAQGISEEEITFFRANAAGSMPALARAVPRGGWAGIYDDTPDYHPILDRLEPYAGLYCAVGFSGHGFKLSPQIGQWMSTFILTGSKPPDMQHFAFDRFAQDQQIRPRYSSGVLG